MPVTPLEILELASLLSKAEAETAHRAAISRAYYAVYHHGVRVVDAKLNASTPRNQSRIRGAE